MPQLPSKMSGRGKPQAHEIRSWLVEQAPAFLGMLKGWMAVNSFTAIVRLLTPPSGAIS